MNNKIVAYDASNRKWVYNGPGDMKVEFPAGNDGKAAAHKMRLKVEIPKLHQMIKNVEKQPNINLHVVNRARNGAIIVMDDEVLAPADTDPPTVVCRVATTTTEEYIISQNEFNLYTCTCRDWENGQTKHQLPELHPHAPTRGAPYIENVGIMCKHTWAAHFMITLKRLLSLTNPNSEECAERLHQILKNHFKDEPELKRILDDCKTNIMSRGNFYITMNQDNYHFLNVSANQHLFYQLKKAVVDATNHSQRLLIV